MQMGQEVILEGSKVNVGKRMEIGDWCWERMKYRGFIRIIFRIYII